MKTFQKFQGPSQFNSLALGRKLKSRMSDTGMAGCWFEARGQNQSANVDYQREILSTSSLSL